MVHIKLVFDDSTVIENDNIVAESLDIYEALCDEQNLKFGSCVSTSVKLNVVHDSPLKGKTFELWIDYMLFGKFKVESDKIISKSVQREIIAYDAIHDVFSYNMASWYNYEFADNPQMSVKTFRDHFFYYWSIPQEEASLVNDDLIITKQLDTETISGQDVLRSICEVNGVFGHVGADGKFRYQTLKRMQSELYPGAKIYPASNLYPRTNEKDDYIVPSGYITALREDYDVTPIDSLQINAEDGTRLAKVGMGSNTYLVDKNILCYGLSAETAETVGNRILNNIRGYVYAPAEINSIANMNDKLGSIIEVSTNKGTFTTYVMIRRLKGIQAMMSKIESKGDKTLPAVANTLKKQVQAAYSAARKAEEKTEDVERHVSTVESTFSSQIIQTNRLIELEVTRAKDEEEALSSSLSIVAGEISSKVSKGSVISEINQTAEQIKISASKINLEGYVTADNIYSTIAGLSSLKVKYLTVDNNSIRCNVGGNEVQLSAKQLTVNGTTRWFLCS